MHGEAWSEQKVATYVLAMAVVTGIVTFGLATTGWTWWLAGAAGWLAFLSIVRLFMSDKLEPARRDWLSKQRKMWPRLAPLDGRPPKPR